jgi:flagellar capping protein FliD
MTSLKSRITKLEKSKTKINRFANWTDSELEAELRRIVAKFNAMDCSAYSSEEQATINRLKKQIEELDRSPTD